MSIIRQDFGNIGNGGSSVPIETKLSSIRVNESTATNIVFTAETSGVYAVFAASSTLGCKANDTCITNGTVLAEGVAYSGSDANTYFKSMIVKLNAGQTVTRTDVAPSGNEFTSALMVYKLSGIKSATYISSALNIENIDSNVTISDTTKKYLVMGTALGDSSARFWSTAKTDFQVSNYQNNKYRYFFACISEGVANVIHAYGTATYGRAGVVLFEIS